ncbi:MAG: 3-oxoacyl-[acyl-carrier-protein] synthase III C-terminal domain-containing protein [Polyangiales bacterium]
MRPPLGAGIRSLAVALPEAVRTNDYYRERFPAQYREAERRTVFKRTEVTEARPGDPFAAAMARFADDPFRGTVERRVLGPGACSLDLEVPAARKALAAAGLRPEEVGLVILTSFPGDRVGIGNSAFLSRALGIKRPAWNLESACSSANVALQTASSLVSAGQYDTVLVVLSCTYSRSCDDADPLTWFFGDGAGAFVVGRCPAGEGLLGVGSVSTVESCETWFFRVSDLDTQRIQIGCTENTGRVLAATAAPYLRACCDEAAREAGVSLADVDFFVFNAPTAWYVEFCARTLGVDLAKTINIHPQYGNIGPALPVVGLYEAARAGRLRRGDLVLTYTVGSVSTASASVMRWGDVALGA